MKRIIYCIIPMVLMVLCFCFFSASLPAMAKGGKTKVIIDNCGRKVKIPYKVNKIACMPGPSYEMVFMLGGKDQICQVRKDHRFSYPLANLTNPDLINYPSKIANINPKARINIEEFIKINPDIVIYYNVPNAIKKFEEALIPVYVYQANKKARTFDQGVKKEKEAILSLAEVIGGKAVPQAEKWCKYYDEIIKRIRTRTKGIPENSRPKVYLGNSWGTNPLATWAGNTQTFAIRLCGGICVTKDIRGAKFPEVNLEQIIKWNPDIIIIDNHGRNPGKVIKDIYKNSDWSVLNAVKQKRIYRIPSGVFFLDKGSSRPLYFLWLAKHIVPEKFTDINMVKEMKRYFKEFYRYNLSTKDAEHALKGWDFHYGNKKKS